MSAPIWQKQQQSVIDSTIMEYMAGEDIELDKQLIQYDIQASKAHVRGLHAIDILSEVEAQKLLGQLDQLSAELQQGKFKLTAEFEDCHSAIEFYLTKHLGELGKKIHTGRSRNDQVLVATRLFLKASLSLAIHAVQESVSVSLSQAKANEMLAMPGYTHLQRAVPSSAGMWFAGLAEAMIDNLMSLQSTLALVDANPLGTAAGYGVNLPLDRELTTRELEFARLQINPIYTQNSRGKFELAVLSALSQCLLDVRRFSWDLSLFTTQEFDFIDLPDEMTTGSSIMPNKRNPDLIELMRASYAQVQAAMVELQSILSLPSGYQRDLQMTKAPMLRGVNMALNTLRLFPRVIAAIQLKTDKIALTDEPAMHATDLAVELSAQGMPFRDAYQQVLKRYDQLKERNAQTSIEQRQSPGACANLMLDELTERFASLAK